jgi:Tfp pilus assembly protein PilV
MRTIRRPEYHHGSGLIETLVALLILSLGMLAVTRMLTHSIASLNNALNHQRAAFTLNNLTELLHGMPANLLRAPPAAADYACSSGSVCTPEQFLADRLQYWSMLVDRQLPGGTGAVQMDTLNNQDVLRASVSWPGSGETRMQHTAFIPLPPEVLQP